MVYYSRLVSYVLFVCIISMVSCTKEISYDHTEWEKKLVVNSIFTALEPFKVRLTTTRNLLDENDQISQVSGALVVLKNGAEEELEILNELSNTGLYFSKEVKPFPGEKYILEVSHPDFPDDYRAESKLPVLSVENRIDTSIIDLSGNKALKVNVLISDSESNENEMYIFEIDLEEDENKLATLFDYDEEFIIHGDKIEPKRLFLSDQFFNGNQKSVEFYTYEGIPDTSENGRTEIRMYNASSEYVKYIKSLEEYDEASKTITGNLANPVSIYTNIRKKGSDDFGLGIFAGAHRKRLIIQY